MKVGDLVKIKLGYRYTDTHSRIVKITQSTGSKPLFVLANGQWLDANEIEPA